MRWPARRVRLPGRPGRFEGSRGVAQATLIQAGAAAAVRQLRHRPVMVPLMLLQLSFFGPTVCLGHASEGGIPAFLEPQRHCQSCGSSRSGSKGPM